MEFLDIDNLYEKKKKKNVLEMFIYSVVVVVVDNPIASIYFWIFSFDLPS